MLRSAPQRRSIFHPITETLRSLKNAYQGDKFGLLTTYETLSKRKQGEKRRFDCQSCSGDEWTRQIFLISAS